MKVHSKNTCVGTTYACVTYEQNLCFCLYVTQICVYTTQTCVTPTQVFLECSPTQVHQLEVGNLDYMLRIQALYLTT